MIYLQNPDATFSKKASYTLPPPWWVFTLGGDLNEDGHLDLLLEISMTDLFLMLGKGDGTFQEPRALDFGATISPILTDLNGDQHLDVVAGAVADGRISVFLGKGDGTFTQSAVLATALWPQSPPAPGSGQIMVGDVNRDEKPDLVVASPQQDYPGSTGNLDVCFGKDDGTFQDPITTPNVAAFRGAVGDFNGDGVLDFAGGRYTPAQIEIWLGQGDGHFAKGRTLSVPNAPILIHPMDFNADGILDLVVSGETDRAGAPLAILIGRGDGTFDPSRSFTPIPNHIIGWNGVQVRDVNSDGRTDLLTVVFNPYDSVKEAFVVLSLNPAPKPDPTGGALLQIASPSAEPLVVERSANLSNWTPMATNSSPQGLWSVVDPSKAEAQRFYRTRAP